jgi:hypothetical protein
MGHLPDGADTRACHPAGKQQEAHHMANVKFIRDTEVPAAAVLAAATDFSDRRPALWPTIDRAVFRVHEVGDSWAEVTEGSAFLGRIWARERYDWSTPGRVRATVLDSNVFRPGGTWELEASETDGRTKLRVWSRRGARGPRGRMLGAIMTLAGRSILASNLDRTLRVLAGERASVGG